VYTRAYGGRDESVYDQWDELMEAVQPFAGRDNLCHFTVGTYPRNPTGVGYIIHEGKAMEGLRLPNLEDPDELLTPETLAVNDPYHWYGQPMSAGFDWYSYDWFPRSAHLGVTWSENGRPDMPKSGDPPIREVRMGLLSPDIFELKPIEELISDRVTNGASPGLAVPYLKGDEWVRLVHLDPNHPEFSFQLPKEVPRIFVKPLDEQQCELEPVLFSVIIHKERKLLSMVWGGRTETRWPYGPEQEQKVPFKVLWK